MATQARVFTIPASARFLPALVDALMADRLGLGFKPGGDPLVLAGVTLYLPTRRACRMARAAFLDALDGDAAILPRIVSLDDIDADEIMFSEAAAGIVPPDALELPDTLEGLARLAPLSQLILKWAEAMAKRSRGRAPLVANTPAAALALARDLARLMDDMTTREVDWRKLEGLVPDGLDPYWQQTLEFLTFIRPHWQAYLAEQGVIEPAERRVKLIEAEARRLAGSEGPVIAAGSTGSIPATAMLLETVAKLPHGALVLPGLDLHLDAEAWDPIGGGEDGKEPANNHPQFAMHALLKRIGIGRDAVASLAPPALHGRERIVSEALCPADATEQWQRHLTEPEFAAHADAALHSVVAIEAANAEEEALTIAIALREAAEDKGKTAALVTPDRALARRVIAALARWNVAADDSGGDPLPDTPAGAFAMLVAEAALSGLEPVTLLALLKHPHCILDRSAAETLELAVLRGPRPRPNAVGLAHALATFRSERSSLHRTDPRLRLTDVELDAAAALIGKLADALAPLERLPPKPMTFAAIAELHRAALAALGRSSDELEDQFDKIAESGGPPVEPAQYPELFGAVIADRQVRRPERDVRVRIFGTVDARLVSVDRMVLGGLVEGAWPPETRADPWLSRPMRHQLGLDLPERRVGLSAHDFAQALGAPEVFLTRAAKIGGAPTVASRFVQRLAAVAGGARWQAALDRGVRYLDWARSLDIAPPQPKPAGRPSPKPPVAARPRRLSVTEIEDWLRDPYTIYARHVLALQPLDPVDAELGAADRGTLIHDAIGEFSKRFAKEPPPDPARALVEIGRERFKAYADYPEVRAFWWPRFERIAHWFAGFDADRRSGLAAIYSEIGGSIPIPFGSDVLTLSVRADRIERLKDGRYAVLDYKTGQPPSDKQVRTDLSPQLTLESAILRRGGFKDIPAGASVAELLYVRLRGGEPAGEPKVVDLDGSTPDDIAERALARLTEMAARFADPDTPYHSLVHPMWSTHYGTYDHLARVKEWSLTGGAGDDGGGA
ncbi:MAG: double-strand break repair protein AddB [Alphaproteobacteria bacterium]|nr:double-strand break repair protein AddB [Alphaproteobacteria bacterium]